MAINHAGVSAVMISFRIMNWVDECVPLIGNWTGRYRKLSIQCIEVYL
jgi:hypothetical protein